jgi:hypothetical protein
MPRPYTEVQERQRRDLLARIDAVGLSARRDELAALLKPAIALHTRAATPADLAVGASRVGGEPDLPPGQAWPAGTEGPLHFVLQVRLEDVAVFDLEERLPATGLLSVFCDVWGREVVILHLDGVDLERRAWVPREHGPFVACGVDVTGEIQPPPPASAFVGGDEPLVDLSSEEHDLWWDDVWLEWREAWRPGPAGACGIHQLLGYAAAERFEEQERHEQVIVGFDSDDRAAMQWGDVHTVWALLRDEDLVARAWGSVRAAM